jgi:Fic family protein
MMTLRLFSENLETIPATTSWYLADLGEARGKQELFTRQAPQRLKVLREHALIESAISSNRIEGVVVDQARIGTIIFGRSHLRDRNEEEVRGYQKALKSIHEKAKNLPITEETITMLHRLSRGEIWDAGKYKEKDGDIIERYPDGRERVCFKTVSAVETPSYMQELEALWAQCLREQSIHPLIVLATFNFDFLCIHPFRDGNGRVSRLLLLLQSYQLGYEVGRYVSLERLIEQNKERYYETLEQSSRGWHEGKQNPWPYINYLLSILKMAYKEFEARFGQIKSPRGAKTDLIEAAVKNFDSEFTLTDLERACPGVSRDMVRRVLRNLQAAGDVECLGRGPGALWRGRKRGNILKKG